MMLGMSLATFTLVHVVISLIGILSGLAVLVGMWRAQRRAGWTALFLLSTVLTSVTGFMFPFTAFGPSQTVGAISLVALVIAILALYVARLARSWRWVYVICAVLALYLNVFVGVVQSFQKLPFLRPLAPTQSEPPFLVAQIAVLVIFLIAGFVAARKFHPERRSLS